MSEHKIIRQLLADIAEEDAPASSIDLAAGVKQGYLAGRAAASSARRWALGIGAAALVTAGTLLAVPTTRATLDQAIEDLLRRMGFDLAPASETNTTTAMLLESTTIPATPMLVPVTDIRAQAPFPVRLPTWLPDGVTYETGGIHNKGGDGSVVVALSYRRAGDPPGPDAPVLWLEMSAGDLPPFYLSEEAAQAVEVNGRRAIYIHGSWTTDKPLQPGETANGLFWDYAADDSYLSWVEDGIAYRIRTTGLGLQLEDVVKIAESLK